MAEPFQRTIFRCMAMLSNPSWPPPLPASEPSHTLIAAVAEALHAHGTASYRLEEAVARLSRTLGVRARVFATPTSVQLALSSAAGTATELLRGTPQAPNLGELAKIDRIIAEVERGELGAREAFFQLQSRKAEAAASRPLLFAASAVACGSAAVFFRGSLHDVVAAAALGAFVAALHWITAARTESSRVHEPLAAFLVSLFAWGIAAHSSRIQPEVIVLSALITLIPGLTVTTAVSELAAGHLVSGTSRLFGAATLFVSLAFGVALGHTVAAPFGTPLKAQPATLAPTLEFVFILIAPLAFALLFRAGRRDLPWIWLAGLVAFASARLGAHALGPELGGFVGATVLGVLSNVYARVLDRPASLLLLPGLLLLVPGSIGFHSLSSFLAEDPIAGTAGIFRVALMAMALVAGMFTANLLASPRRSL